MDLPNGNYTAHANGGTLGETSKGDPQVVVEFQLLNEGYEQVKINWFGYFTEKSRERTIESLRTAGWTGDDLTDLSELATRDDIPQVELVIENETYEGKTRAKVQWVNQPGSVHGGKVLAPDKAKAFAAMMKATIAATDFRHGLKKPAPARPSLPPPGNSVKAGDDIPF